MQTGRSCLIEVSISKTKEGGMCKALHTSKVHTKCHWQVATTSRSQQKYQAACTNLLARLVAGDEIPALDQPARAGSAHEMAGGEACPCSPADGHLHGLPPVHGPDRCAWPLPGLVHRQEFPLACTWQNATAFSLQSLSCMAQADSRCWPMARSHPKLLGKNIMLSAHLLPKTERVDHNVALHSLNVLSHTITLSMRSCPSKPWILQSKYKLPTIQA